jgi:DNA-binding GntR family transcriptional regulator
MQRLTPLTRAPLCDVVADNLRRAILSGAIRPGQPLQENALAQQLSVSRSPVREALIQLERERLVVGRVNRPAVVRRLSPDEIRQVYTIRAALEGIAARWAAANATPQLVMQLEQRAEELDRATSAVESSGSEVAALAIDFHMAIAEAAGSVELLSLLRSLGNQIKLVMAAGLATLTRRRTQDIHAEHLEILAAIAAHDGDRAESLAIAHVHGARDRLVDA